MSLDQVLARGESCALTVVAGFPVGSQRLMLAIDAIDRQINRPSASAILEITLDKKLSIERIHERDASAIDYVFEDGWHGLLLRDGIEQVTSDGVTFTSIPVGEKGSTRRLARSGGVVYACGTAADEVDGFIGCLDAKHAWRHLTAMSDGYERGTFEAMHFPTPAEGYAVGSWGALFRGNAKGFTAVPLPDLAFSVDGDPKHRHSLRGVHVRADGTVLLAGRDFAGVYADGAVTKLGGDKRYVDACAEYRGVEYWALENGMAERLEIATRTDNTLTTVFAGGKQKRHRPQYARGRITVRDDLMIVTHLDRIHIFDGKAWTSLKLQPEPSQLVKRIPVGMKPV
jgi:hypothetical protein